MKAQSALGGRAKDGDGSWQRVATRAGSAERERLERERFAANGASRQVRAARLAGLTSTTSAMCATYPHTLDPDAPGS